MNTPSEWATNKAREMATAWYHGCGFPCDGNDLPALEAAIARAIDDARRVPDGHVREGVTDRKVLGTLPVTADGCVAGIGATVYEVSSSGVWTPAPRDLYHRPLSRDCYSTRAAAEEARST